LAEAVASADIVTCATLTSEPLIRGEWLRSGTHLDLVGGYTPQMREADDEAVRRARVYIDTEAALHEAGDIVQPLRSGVLIRDKIAGDLFALARGQCVGRQTPTEITFFKSVGSALEDLAAAELAVSRLEEAPSSRRRPGPTPQPPRRRKSGSRPEFILGPRGARTRGPG
jgi:ornithine cyclodeaminase